jgi:hypothetical protein
MQIFIDFDDVVFNSKKFIDDYSDLFKKHKILKKYFKKFYYDYPQKHKNLRKYDPKKHLQRIAEELDLPTGSLQRDIKSFIKNTRKYTFEDLKYFKNIDSGCLYLISYSRTNFQKEKINNSGIKKYFKKIIITDFPKSKVMKEIIKTAGEGPVYFLDNRVEHIENVKKNIPRVITILMRRREDRYRDKKTKFCDFEAKNLKEAYQIIKQTCQ